MGAASNELMECCVGLCARSSISLRIRFRGDRKEADKLATLPPAVLRSLCTTSSRHLRPPNALCDDTVVTTLLLTPPSLSPTGGEVENGLLRFLPAFLRQLATLPDTWRA